MTTSEKIGAIAQAIVKAQAEMPKLLADSDNPYYKSKYIANSISVQKPIDRTAPVKAAPVKHDDLKPLKDKLVEIMKDPLIKPEEREGQKKAWAGTWDTLTRDTLEAAISSWEKVLNERKQAAVQPDIF